MRWIKKNPAQFLLVAGSILIAQSALWEYARMHPDYRFLVEPWAIRGYSTTQGRAIGVMGVGLFILSVIVFTEYKSDKAWLGPALGVAVWIAAIVIALVAAPEEVDVKLGTLAGLAVSLGIAWVALKLAINFLSGTIEALSRKPVQYLALIVLFLALFLFILNPLVVDETLGLNLAIVVAVLLAGPIILAIGSPPRELVANRVLINSVLGVWIVVGTSGGALRSTLLRLQLEQQGVAAQYKDAQITSGLILAWIGCLLLFVGAVALWARRRDAISAMKRAAQQRAAAVESVAELEGQH